MRMDKKARSMPAMPTREATTPNARPIRVSVFHEDEPLVTVDALVGRLDAEMGGAISALW